MKNLELPSYLEQSDRVSKRFEKLKEREVILEVKDLVKTFDSQQGQVTALKDINFKTHRREFVCVIGPSGCGKSTLIGILAALQPPSSGQVLLDGEPKSEPGPDRGMVFQGYTLFPWLTIKKNVMFGLQMEGKSKSTAESEALQWIELVGLSKFADSYPHQLSGGMAQRVSLARAFAITPDLLLLDEPFSALDNTLTNQLTRLLKQFLTPEITLIYISHQIEQVLALTQSCVLIKRDPHSQTSTISQHSTATSNEQACFVNQYYQQPIVC